MVTKMGTVKKTILKAFSNPRATGIIAIDIDQGDELIDVQITNGDDNILLATAQGKAIRFPEKDVRSMGRTARGVVGIRMEKGDSVIGMSLAADESTVLTVTENGYGKRTKVGEYRLQHRGGQGIINIKTSERNGKVIGMLTVDDNDEIVLVSTDGIVMRCGVRGIRTIGRNTQGVKVMTPRPGAKVSAVAKAVAETKEQQITDVETGGTEAENGAGDSDTEEFTAQDEEE